MAEKSTSITLKIVKTCFISTCSKYKFKSNPYEDLSIEQIFDKVASDSDTKYSKFSKETSSYISDRGLLKCSDDPCLILNGVLAEGTVENYQELIVRPILGEQGQFQMKACSYFKLFFICRLTMVKSMIELILVIIFLKEMKLILFRDIIQI